MHNHHIGEDNSHLSSEDATSTPTHQNPSQTHFSIQVSPSSPHPLPPNSPKTPFYHERFSDNPSQTSPRKRIPLITLPCRHFPTPFGAKFPTSKLLPRFRFLIFLPLPSLYFLLSNPAPFDFFCVIAFSAALLISLNLALLLFTRLFPAKFSSSSSSASSSSPSAHPVVWSIGSNPKQVKSTSWGCWVQVYSNGDVYEGEFQEGKCWGSGVYHYHMSGRYEGDWVDGKYDGYGVETWARGSRYRGQYRKGLRHGMGIYRFYSGDVYGGEWSNGQCHGFGVHTCSDGSRYVGEFKWGVKHGHAQYHFRYVFLNNWNPVMNLIHSSF